MKKHREARSRRSNHGATYRRSVPTPLLLRPFRFLLLPTILVVVISLMILNAAVHQQMRRLESTAQTPPQAMQWQSSFSLRSQHKALLYPQEPPIPNPPLPVNGSSHFSACLLVMDDNLRLAEWLAYHYHVLPLRYLIIAVDPRSQTSPTYFLNRWRRQGMVIEEWRDEDFWRKNLTGSEPIRPLDESTANLQKKRDRHRGRQKYFYKTCLERMQNLDRTWVSLHDSDEYLVYNHAGGDKFEAWQQRMQERHGSSRQHGHVERLQPKMIPPTTGQPGQMIQYIEHERSAGLPYYQSPCIGIPRLQFGAAESTLSEQAADVPTDLSSMVHNLDTLRWRKHAARNDFVKNALGKVILDVSRLPPVSTLPYFQSLHRPIKKLCPAPWINEWSTGLRLNHYLGSWEAYSFRDDSRRGNERSREQWEYKATINQDQTDDVIRPWIAGFVEEHGPAKAKGLLKDSGVPSGYKAPDANDPHWSMEPERVAEILAADETISNDNKKVAFDAWVRQRYKNKETGKAFELPRGG